MFSFISDTYIKTMTKRCKVNEILHDCIKAYAMKTKISRPHLKNKHFL